jgi:hypothetical protein
MTKHITTPSAKLTQEQVEKLDEAIKKYALILGMSDWRVTSRLKDLDSDTLAECLNDEGNRVITIHVNENWPSLDDCTNELFELTMIHEILEGMLSRTRDLLLEHHKTDFVDEHMHSIIRRLEKAVYQQLIK